MENKLREILDNIAKKYNLPVAQDEEKEPYLLTKDDEEKVLEHEIISLKKYTAWKMATMGFSEEWIQLKFSQVEWEKEINREQILTQANANKNYALWQIGQRAKEREEEAQKKIELQQRWTAEYFYKYMAWNSEKIYGKPFIEHEYNRHLIVSICYFLSNDPRFETDLKYSFQKGLYIRGISGLGKTFLLKCVAKNKLNPIRILSTLEVTDVIKSEGKYDLDMGENKILYIDDVGTEETMVNYFGTKIYFFKNYIERYYLNYTNYSRLILSTNNSFEEIESLYGFRVRSRLSGDMMNVINIKGYDMRPPQKEQ